MEEAPREIDAVYGDNGKKGKDKDKGKHRGKQENSPLVIVESGDTKQKESRYKNTPAEVDEEKTVDPPNNASSITNRVIVRAQLEPRSLQRRRSPPSWKITRNPDGSAISRQGSMTRGCERMSL